MWAGLSHSSPAGRATSSVHSDHKAEHLERACLILAACGLRIVPVTEHTYDEADITALRQLATKGLAHFAPRRGGE